MVVGVAMSGMLFFGAKAILPTSAAEDDTSDNSTMGLTDIFNNIEKIYNDALTMPFKKVESKIHDPEIAEYYHALMSETGLSGTRVE